MRLDKELELTVGLKERTIGALRQHTKEHRCQPWNAASASRQLPLFWYGFYSDIWIAGIFESILCSFCAERAVKGRHRQSAPHGAEIRIRRWF